ncbi:MFS transporter [Leptogranulimonas caecicola]|uniref:Major facilitator superfamily (MFS) profile domain-containing protein n=1 Tax=Leptogranulimonas caecicola TaxID=2894156 RepID=A0AAU9CZH0_9ACTN|nr:MFS transporter [Leptogranulimonas caecicola]BDC90215.1 hypothetical protein ATTO_00870 [Leptogranulimonas caecicola]
MRKRIPILIVGTITLLFLGLIYGYSVVMAPLKAQFDWSVSGMTVIFALSMISFTIGNLVAGKLLKRHNVRFVMTVAIAFLLVGFIGSALVDGAASLPAVWCTYGVIASVGIGFVYNVIVPTITAWYPDKTGMAQGVCLMGYGLGGFVLGPVLTQLYTVMDWRIVFVAMAVIFSGLVFASSIVIHMPSPEEAAQLPASKAMGDNAGNAAGTKDVPTHELFRDPTFYFFYLWMFLLGAVGMATTGIGREFPTSLGADAVTAAFVIGFVNIGSGLGRRHRHHGLCGAQGLGSGQLRREPGSGQLLRHLCRPGGLHGLRRAGAGGGLSGHRACRDGVLWRTGSGRFPDLERSSLQGCPPQAG